PPPTLSPEPSRVSARVETTILWCLWFAAEIFLLVLLWGSGEPAYDLGDESSPVDTWTALLLAAMTVLLLGLTALGIRIWVRLRRTAPLRSTAMGALIAGGMAIVAGSLMVPRGSIDCYRSCAPSVFCRNHIGCGWGTPSFDAYLRLFHISSWIVIGAGCTLMVVSITALTLTRRDRNRSHGHT
ncbi:MAG: hypothetical protein KGR18_12215, partial [Acidobacteria bacterium]|nr:hypothetical protein [Acidobacteriota bacterium]